MDYGVSSKQGDGAGALASGTTHFGGVQLGRLRRPADPLPISFERDGGVPWRLVYIWLSVAEGPRRRRRYLLKSPTTGLQQSGDLGVFRG